MSEIIIEKDEKETLSWGVLFGILREQKILIGKLWWLIPLMLVYVGFIVTEPYFYKLFMDGVEKILAGSVSLNEGMGAFLWLSGIWGVFTLASLFAAFFYRWSIWNVANVEWERFTKKLTKKFFQMPFDYHVSLNLGERVKIADRGPQAAVAISQRILDTVLPQGLTLLGFLMLGFLVNWRMMIVVLTFLPLIILISYFIGGKVHARQKEADDKWDRAHGRLSDALQNIGVIKMFARSEHETGILSGHNSAAISKQQSINVLWGILDVGANSLEFLVKVAVMVVGVWSVVHKSLTIGELFMFVTLSGRFYWPLQSLEYTYRDIVARLANCRKMNLLLSAPSESDNGSDLFEWMNNAITFDLVSFSYPSNDREVLKNISLEIKKGQKVAFVGHTGSGKTTMTHLLARFYEPTAGAVRIDGMDIRDFTLESYRSRLAAVFQDTTLFNDTIRHNLEYVRDDVSFERIREACRQANILEFIEGLEKGFDTEVGERGLKLSGGEKQRLAIARAIIADPEILILDEATSALDARTEHLVQDAFNHLMEGRTSIIIAHRLSTIRHADRIFLFEKGELIGSGSHDELYGSSPVYREMVDYQKDGFVEEGDQIIA